MGRNTKMGSYPKMGRNTIKGSYPKMSRKAKQKIIPLRQYRTKAKTGKVSLTKRYPNILEYCQKHDCGFTQAMTEMDKHKIPGYAKEE